MRKLQDGDHVNGIYTYKDKPKSSAEERPVDKDPISNCCTAPFTYPGWPDSDLCSKCFEHADIGEENE
tara:strand:+ start:277 stop:480 length:204 start_codon:yes stop_codon:yes gene_type:complete